MTRDDTDTHVLQPVLGNLERTLIDEFLRLRGLDDRDALDTLPETERHDLLVEASTYASARLTEIESRSHYVHELHGAQDASGHGVK
jgi:hypothetical protein